MDPVRGTIPITPNHITLSVKLVQSDNTFDRIRLAGWPLGLKHCIVLQMHVDIYNNVFDSGKV